VDVGAPTGPGVNEGSFWDSAKRARQYRFSPLFVRRNLAGMPRRRGRLAKVLGYCAGQVRGFLGVIVYRLSSRSGDVCFVRAGVLPIGIAAGLAGSSKMIHLKTVGDLDILTAEFGSMFPRRLRDAVHSINLRLWRRLFAHASSADACTPELRGILVSLFGLDALPPIWVIPNGVSAHLFASIGRTREPSELLRGCVGYLGGAPLERGGKSVIDLVRAATGRGLELRGLVAGSHSAELEAYAREKGVEDRVDICGLVAPDQVPMLMGRVDVGLAMDGGARHDRVGNSYQKVSQYLAAGAAVVTTKVSDDSIARLLNVRIVPPNDFDALFGAVTDLLSRPSTAVASAVQEGISFVEMERSNDRLLQRRLDLIAGIQSASPSVEPRSP